MRRAFPTFFRISGAFLRAGRGLIRVWPWLAGILAVLLVAHTIFSILAGRALSRELAKIKASGAPLSPAELAPPPVPEAENAAVVYQRAFELLPRGGEGSAFSRARAFANPTRYRAERTATEREAADFVRQQREALDLLRQAATMPKARYPVDWSAGGDALFPHLPELRRSTDLLAVDALVQARRGDPSGALADVAVMLHMADSVAAEPNMISQLLRLSCQHIALETLHAVMQTATPSAEDCRRLESVLAHIELTHSFTRALEGERAFTLWYFGQFRRGTPYGLYVVWPDDDKSETAKRLFRLAVVRFLWAPCLKIDEVRYLRYMDRQIALSRKACDRSAYDALDRRLKRMPWYAFVTQGLAPVFSRAHQRRDGGIAIIGLAQWGLALRVYQSKMGRYPAALGDVSTVVDWSLPKDPFSGRPPVCRREGAGYVLYSVGANRRDDHATERGPSESAFAPGAADDIVWRMTR